LISMAATLVRRSYVLLREFPAVRQRYFHFYLFEGLGKNTQIPPGREQSGNDALRQRLIANC